MNIAIWCIVFGITLGGILSIARSSKDKGRKNIKLRVKKLN
ncbi:hypothetical protein GCM10023142_39980 [Anaerocolumna aminovalerica]|uniref:Uncharacterized protein n=1 Tax=Anaerocolumna aminovalerica TaxID=1527 RepID=A0A1I5EX30_9FIRM|nr:hypothetical protein [Anaerocolumna aminovalerica]SFO16072.1 hypothetical protein SAMN04489757_11150 [Anaerocolumna aminovalerica]